MTVAVILILSTLAAMACVLGLIVFSAARLGGLADDEMERLFEQEEQQLKREEVVSEWQEHSKS